MLHTLDFLMAGSHCDKNNKIYFEPINSSGIPFEFGIPEVVPKKRNLMDYHCIKVILDLFRHICVELTNGAWG